MSREASILFGKQRILSAPCYRRGHLLRIHRAAGGRQPPSLQPGGRGLMAGIEEVPAARKKMVAGGIWMLARSLFFLFSFLSPPGILLIFIRYNCLFSGKTNPPFFFFFFFSFPSFWRGLMESRFNYNNFLVMWAFWEARFALKWIGHGSSQIFLLNQTYVLSNVRPELFIVYSCLCFSLCVILIFHNRHSYFYLLYLIFGRSFHLGGLISRMHTSDYISFTEWECFCFSSFTEYNFGFMNIQCML